MIRAVRHGLSTELVDALIASGLPWEVEISDRLSIVVIDGRIRLKFTPGQCLSWLRDRAERNEMDVTEYLMEPRSDGIETTVSVLAGTEHRKPELVIRDEHVNQAASAWVTPAIARALVRALLPLCPEPLAGAPDYPAYLRDVELVDAARRVLGPVMALDVEPDPRGDGDDRDYTDEPF